MTLLDQIGYLILQRLNVDAFAVLEDEDVAAVTFLHDVMSVMIFDIPAGFRRKQIEYSSCM